MVRAKSTRPAPVKKKAVAKPVRRTTQRKAKKKPQREMPSWLRYVIAGIIAFYSLPLSFISLSVLTLTVGSLAMALKHTVYVCPQVFMCMALMFPIIKET